MFRALQAASRRAGHLARYNGLPVIELRIFTLDDSRVPIGVTLPSCFGRPAIAFTWAERTEDVFEENLIRRRSDVMVPRRDIHHRARRL